MGDEQIGEAELLLQTHQQVQDLSTDRDIKRRDGLVANQKLGFERERPGNPHALSLTAGKLMGEPVEGRRAQPDPLQQPAHPILYFRLATDPVHLQRLGDDLTRRLSWVQRCIGILENHLDLWPQGFQFSLGAPDQILTVQHNLSPAGFDEAQQGLGQG